MRLGELTYLTDQIVTFGFSSLELRNKAQKSITTTLTTAVQWDWKRHALTVPLEALVRQIFFGLGYRHQLYQNQDPDDLPQTTLWLQLTELVY